MSRGIFLDALVDILVGDLYKYLKTEGQYALEFQNQFEEMKTQLTLMRAFLTDADRLKKQHEIVKTIYVWFRELTYEANDLVIDCLIRADYRKRTGSCCYHFSPRELFFRYQTGKKLTDINVRIVKMRENLSHYVSPIVAQQLSSEVSGISTAAVGRWTSQVIDQSEIVGLTEDVRKVQGWISPQTDLLHRIGIVGMGGLGKTTITQKIFNNIDVSHSDARFRTKIWISVSQTFSEVEIMKSMLRQLEVVDFGYDTGQLLHKIHEVLLKIERYLIVMDDVWSIDSGWWDRISSGLPKIEGQSSCVIITSRNEDVLRRMGVVEARIHRPRCLNGEESWSLFCKVAFMATNGICKYPQLEELGKQIVEKCRGLPLAIKTIGGLLSSKAQSYGEWKRISDNFHEKLATEGSGAVFVSLQLSYDELPTYIKHCLLCFSIFPEDHVINAEQLIYWWIGEGFVQERSAKFATESALRCLSILISRCLVEVVNRRNYDGRIYECKMHDLVRDLTIRIASEEAFCSFDGENHIATVDSLRLGVTSEMDLRTLGTNSRLRALLLMTARGHPFSFDRNAGLPKVKSLRVLDLSNVMLGSSIKEDRLWKWITSLKRLACLNLRNAVGLVELPDSVGKLWSLQVLILAQCKSLEKLSPSITTLEKLRVLNVANCTSLLCLPRGLSKLSNLEELHGFTLGDQTKAQSCHIRELKDLTRLRILQIKIRKNVIDQDELNALAQLQQLRVFGISAGNYDNVDFLQMLDKLSPPPHIEELYLGHYGGETTPEWINPTSLPQLQYLCIENSLVLNHMSHCFWGSNGATWKVEDLCLKYLPKLQERWAAVQRAMPLLRYLEVKNCNMLHSFPSKLMHLGIWKKAEEEHETELP